MRILFVQICRDSKLLGFQRQNTTLCGWLVHPSHGGGGEGGGGGGGGCGCGGGGDGGGGEGGGGEGGEGGECGGDGDGSHALPAASRNGVYRIRTGVFRSSGALQ